MSTKKRWETIRNDLTVARDEIRLKVHLGGMDAKQTWDALEEQLRDLEHKAELGADHVADAVFANAARLKTDFDKLRSSL